MDILMLIRFLSLVALPFFGQIILHQVTHIHRLLRRRLKLLQYCIIAVCYQITLSLALYHEIYAVDNALSRVRMIHCNNNDTRACVNPRYKLINPMSAESLGIISCNAVYIKTLLAELFILTLSVYALLAIITFSIYTFHNTGNIDARDVGSEVTHLSGG